LIIFALYMKKLFVFFLIVILNLLQHLNAQNTDSLWKVYNDKTQADTNRIKAINNLAWLYKSNNPDSAILLAEQELKFANTLPKEKATVWIANAFNAMGASYTNQSNFPKALEHYLKALTAYEETGNKKGMGNCYSNVGIIYFYQSNYPKALEYYLKALKTYEEIDNKKGIGNCYTNMAGICQNQRDFKKALEYDFKALKIKEEIKDKKGIANCYSNIGIAYKEQANCATALDYYLKSLKLKEELGDKQGIVICYVNMSELYNTLANYPLAIQYSSDALLICKEIGDIDDERYAYKNLASVYSKTNKYKEAYENHVKFKALTDSIFNVDNSKQLGDLKTQFEVEKKEAELKIKSDAEQEKLIAIAHEEKKRQQIIIAAVAGVLVLVVIFSLFLLNRFRITQRQKTIIEKQKVLVDKAYDELHEKNKEVMDSIRYAKRIQIALITSEKYITNSLNKLIKN